MGKAKPKKTEKFAKVYREFTRVKFTKYKLQFPRIRQSQIVAKIIKEWEAMDENAKQDLSRKYVERSGKGFLQDPSSSDKEKKEKQRKEKQSKQKEAGSAEPQSQQQKQPQPMSASARQTRAGAQKKKPIKKKKKKPSPKVRVFQQKQEGPSDPKSLKVSIGGSKSPDFKKQSQGKGKKSPGKKQTPDKKQSSSSSLGIKKRGGAISKDSKVPKVSKQKKKNEQYLTFYKYYHERLNAEHPRWSTNQINTIIKLLWRKRHIKDGKRQRVGTGKGLSGRQLYNRSKLAEGFLKDQIKQLWRALPHESKRYWQIKAKGRPHRSKRDSGRYVRKVLNAGSARQQTKEAEGKNVFNWMNQPIKSMK